MWLSYRCIQIDREIRDELPFGPDRYDKGYIKRHVSSKQLPICLLYQQQQKCPLLKIRCPAESKSKNVDFFGGSKKNFGRNMPISDVRYAMKSPFVCDQGRLGPNSGRRCIHNFFSWYIPYAPWVTHTLGPKMNRVSGRFIEKPLGSVVTIDLLVKHPRSFSAIGVDWKIRFRDLTVPTHWVGFCRAFTKRKRCLLYEIWGVTTWHHEKSYEGSAALSWDLACPDRTRKGFS